MRARLHVRGGRIGFFREATHDICDARTHAAAAAGQPATCSIARPQRCARSARTCVREVEVSENVAADQRALHLEAAGPLDSRSDRRAGR